MKNEALVTWRRDPAVLATNDQIRRNAEALPKQRDQRDIARRKLEAAAETLAHTELRHRAGRVSDADLRKARERRDAAHSTFAECDAVLEEALLQAQAAEAVIGEVTTEARRAAGEQLLKIYRERVTQFAPALIALAAQAKELQQLAHHIEADFAGLPTHAGYSRLFDFPADTTVLAPANSIRRVINPRHVEGWLALAREQGFQV